jgi:hypothetical protein
MLRIFLQHQGVELYPAWHEFLATFLRTHVSICHLRLGGASLNSAALAVMLPVTQAKHISLEYPCLMTDFAVSMGDEVNELALDVGGLLSDRDQRLFNILDHFQVFPASRRNLRQIVVEINQNAPIAHAAWARGTEWENDASPDAFMAKLRVYATSLKAVGIDLLQDDGTAVAGGPAPVSVQAGLQTQLTDDDVVSKSCVHERLGGFLSSSRGAGIDVRPRFSTICTRVVCPRARGRRRARRQAGRGRRRIRRERPRRVCGGRERVSCVWESGRCTRTRVCTCAWV